MLLKYLKTFQVLSNYFTLLEPNLGCFAVFDNISLEFLRNCLKMSHCHKTTY